MATIQQKWQIASGKSFAPTLFGEENFTRNLHRQQLQKRSVAAAGIEQQMLPTTFDKTCWRVLQWQQAGRATARHRHCSVYVSLGSSYAPLYQLEDNLFCQRLPSLAEKLHNNSIWQQHWQQQHAANRTTTLDDDYNNNLRNVVTCIGATLSTVQPCRTAK